MSDGIEIAVKMPEKSSELCHILGHCSCCSSYRLLQYQDIELGNLCAECSEHSMSADIELNFGGYGLSRPEASKKS